MRLLKLSVWSLLVLAAAFTLYYPACTIHYYGYDFQYVFSHASVAKTAYWFTHAVPFCKSYHPLPAAFLTAIQSIWGMQTLPLHVAQIALHGFFALCILHAMLALRLGTRAALCGMFFFLIAQTNVIVVAGNSGLAHLSAALAGCSALWLLWEMPGALIPKPVRYAIGVIIFGVGLLCGETAVVYFAPILLLLYWRQPANGSGRFFPALLKSVPFFVILFVYVYVRHRLHLRLPAFTTNDIFGIALGRNVAENIVQLIFSIGTPFSSVRVFQAAATGNYRELILPFFCAGLVCAIMAFGFWRLRRNPGMRAAVVIGILALLPFLCLRHVSEAFGYALLPFAAICAGAGSAMILGDKFSKGWRLYIPVFGLCLLAGSEIGAVREKIALMNETGRITSSLVGQLEPIVRPMPPGYKILFVNPPAAQPDYSVFVMNGFNAVEQQWPQSVALWGRDDLGPYAIMESAGVSARACAFFMDGGSLWLTITDGRVVPYARPSE
jgi:hypothetical protein